jgi:hypothetical protein
MKYLITILFLGMTNTILGQDLASTLHQSHSKFRDTTFVRRRFRHIDMMPAIEKLKSRPDLFEVSTVGTSHEGRSINQIKMGRGATKILLWSQMHGDESTATMALFDIFKFFQGQNDGLDEIRKQILDKCTLYFVPMLNPDGAEVFQRRTALGIDMNRDALRTQTPEGQLLKKLQNDLLPDFGFNLHDQSPRYSAGKTGNLATISFLATAYNEEREINPVRKRSMQLIVAMNKILQQFIPNQVGRYSDEFEPRAFGDNIQKWGTTLILIESGGYKNDPEKQYIRQLNYVSILAGIASVATKAYKKESPKDYEKIPENERYIYDLLIRNVTINAEGRSFVADIGINRNERPVQGKNYFVVSGVIEEFGDMSVFFGTDEINAEGLQLVSESPIKIGSKADFSLQKDGKILYVLKNGIVDK